MKRSAGGAVRLHPGLERRVVGVVEVVEPVLAQEQLHPVARPGLLDQVAELARVGVALVELLEVVGRPVDVELGRGGERRQEEGVGLRPGVADRQPVRELDLGRLAVDDQGDVGAGRGQVLVERHVLPPEAEVVRGEGLPVRPAVALAQVEGEDPPLLDLVGRQDVRDELQVRRAADEAGVAVDGVQAGLAGAADQHPQVAARLPDLGHAHDARVIRRSGNGRNLRERQEDQGRQR